MSSLCASYLLPFLAESGSNDPKELIELLSKIFSPQGALVAFVILGILAALYTAAIKYVFERRLKEKAQQHDERLKRLEALLTEEGAKKQARLAYEYEARKRLYHECAPLIFELLEFAENAGDRIRGLARTARQGALQDWLSGDTYYIASTMYYLLAPSAVFKLMRRRLTVIDLTLDLNIATQYRLAKQIAWSFADDFKFAWGLRVRELEYDPNNSAWQTLRVQNESRYWRQGLPYGRFDNAVESMIVSGATGDLRIMGFGEFESSLHTDGSKVNQAFTLVRDIFTGFHPATRPILWRMLVTQAQIYLAILRFHSEDASRTVAIQPVLAEDRKQYYWKREPTETEIQKMEEPFIVAEAYLRQTLSTLFGPQP